MSAPERCRGGPSALTIRIRIRVEVASLEFEVKPADGLPELQSLHLGPRDYPIDTAREENRTTAATYELPNSVRTHSNACSRVSRAPSNCRVSTASRISPNFGPGFNP